MKKSLVLLITIIATISLSIPAFADWVQEGDKWKYDFRGNFIQGDFKQIDGLWYYFDDYGYMVTGVEEIDGDFYVFNDNGSADTDGVKINGKTYTTSLKGKISKSDELSDYQAKELEAIIKQEIAKDAEEKARMAAAMQSIQSNSANYSLKYVTEEKREGWNKIGNEFRYVNQLPQGDFKGDKKAKEYYNVYLPILKTNTVYFDDKGNAKPLKFSMTADGKLKLETQTGHGEYVMQSITIFNIEAKISYNDKTISKEDTDKIVKAGFNITTYEQDIRNGFQAAYDNSLSQEASDKAKKEEESKQAILRELERENANLKYQNRLKISGSTGATKGIQVYDEAKDKDVNVTLNIRVPQFVGDGSEAVNAMVNAKYVDTVAETILGYFDEHAPNTKSISVSDPSFSQSGTLIRIYVNSSVMNFSIYYDTANNSWYVG